MRKIIGIIFTLLFASNVFGQQEYVPNIDPPSPEASSLGEYIDHPVGHYTGTPKIEIPLFDITSGRINVPIGLSYHAGGVKVDEIASRAGMGWSLNAGGVVSRVLKGWADEYYSTTDQQGVEVLGYFRAKANDVLDHYYSEDIIDTEPDLYYFSSPSFSGKFILEDSNTPVQLEEQNLIVSKTNSGYVITSSDGIKYTFEAVETTITTGSCFPSGLRGYGFKSGWYLTEISDPSTNRSVVFEYKDFDGNIQDLSYDVSRNYTEDVGCHDISTTKSHCWSDNSLWNVKILEKITFDKGYIFFESNHDRQDLVGDDAYTSISLYDNNDVLQTSFEFEYEYSTASNCSGKECKRLWLNSVTEVGKNNLQLPSYNFHYKNKDQLPKRRSPEQDIWGFYNNNGESEFTAPEINVYLNESQASYLPIPAISYAPTQIISGSNRETNSNTIDFGILERIDYPTGGYTTYEYEPHEFYYREDGVKSNLQFRGGGLRVTEIASFDSDGDPEKITEFSYGTGYIGGSVPQAAYPTNNAASEFRKFDKNTSFLGSNPGGIVGYDVVTQWLNDGTGNLINVVSYGFEVSPDIATDIKVDWICQNESSNLNNAMEKTHFPFFEMEDFSIIRGTPKFIKYYADAHNQNPIKTIEYENRLESDFEFNVHVHKHSKGASGSSNYVLVTDRPISKKKVLKEKEIITEYFDDGNEYKTEVLYSYDSKYNLSQKKESTSEGGYLVTDYKYPYDFDDNDIMDDMESKNYISPVIQETISRNYDLDPMTYILSSTITSFDYYSTSSGQDLIQPHKTFVAKINGAANGSSFPAVTVPANPPAIFESRLEFVNYDNYGQPKEIISDGQQIFYSWTSNGDLIEKVVSNSSKDDYRFFLPQNWTEKTGSSFSGNTHFTNDGGTATFGQWDFSDEPTYVSFWAKDGTVIIEESGQSTTNYSVTAPSEWTYYSFIMDPSEWSTAEMRGTGKVDDFRMTKGKPQITTYTYDSSGRLWTINDWSNSLIRYEYDDFGRLYQLQDFKGNVLKEYEYKFQ